MIAYVVSMLTILFSGIGFLIRNGRVYTFRMLLLKKVSDAADVDIKNGREWEWRYDVMDTVSYDTMLLNFWKPLTIENFYSDTMFATPGSVRSGFITPVVPIEQ